MTMLFLLWHMTFCAPVAAEPQPGLFMFYEDRAGHTTGFILGTVGGGK